MGVSAENRHVKALAGQHVGGADTAADDGSPGAVEPCVRALCPAQAEFHDAVSARREHDAGGLCGDETLVIQNVEDGCLHKLGLHDGGNHLQDGLLGEDDRPLGDGVDISRKVEAAQIVEEILAEHAKAAQIVHVLVCEIQIFYVLNDLVQARADGVASVVGVLAEEHIEDDGLVLSFFVISLHHGKLVEVRQQGQIVSAHCSLF